jgi:hypothetical protein
MIRKRYYPKDIEPEFIKISKNDKETLRRKGLNFPLGGETELSHLCEVLSRCNSHALFPCDYGFSEPFIKRPQYNETKYRLDWWIVDFAPYSEEYYPGGYNTRYKTRKECIDKAIEYLDQQGYDAKPIPFVEMIDKI